MGEEGEGEIVETRNVDSYRTILAVSYQCYLTQSPQSIFDAIWYCLEEAPTEYKVVLKSAQSHRPG